MDISEDAITWKKRGDEYVLKENYAEAIQCYEYAVTLEPQFTKAWNNLGYCYLKVGRIEDSEKVKERLSKIKKISIKQDSDAKIKEIPYNYSKIAIVLVIVVIVIIAVSISGLFKQENIENEQNFQTYITPPNTQSPIRYATAPTQTPRSTPTSVFVTQDDERLLDIITDSTLLFYGQEFVDAIENGNYIRAMAAAELANEECVNQMTQIGQLKTSPKFTTIKSEYHESLNDRKKFFSFCNSAANSYYNYNYRSGNEFLDEALVYSDYATEHLKNVNYLISLL